MTTQLHLCHVGEVILAAMPRDLAARGSLDIPWLVHLHCTLAGLLDRAETQAPFSFDANIPLPPTTFERGVGGLEALFGVLRAC